MDETPTATAAALALDLSGRTHIVYSENPVLYATNASGSWSSEPLEPQAGARSPSLAVSNDGVVHVAFRLESTIWYLRLSPTSPSSASRTTRSSTYRRSHP